LFFSLLSGVLSATNFVNQGPPKKYPLQNLYLFTDPKNLFNNYWQGALLVQSCCLVLSPWYKVTPGNNKPSKG